jgi:hypothetical protein
MLDDDAPTVQIALPARRRRWPLVVTAASVLVVLGMGAAVVMFRPAPTTVPVAAAGAGAPVVAASSAPAATPTSTTTSGGCPTAGALVAEYRRAGTSPGRAGAVAKSTVTCASTFAVLTLHSPGDSENVSAIFAVGPPVRFLEAGSGPVCTDDAASAAGSVVVPHAAAAALDCITTTTDAPATEPTLGSVWSPNQQGFGDARPSEVNAGGDSTGVVENVTWSTWGGATAQGRGTGYWLGPDQYSYQATPAPAVLVVDRLGTCQGHAAYLRVRWYFPTHGETAPKADAGFASICGS